MTTRRVASVGNFFQGHFPERQIYHRSRGSVQFMVLSPFMQVLLLLLSLAFLGWVAYASVNVVFKDQIIAAKEHHFAAMQAAYEGRLAEMQASYDELNGALVLTEERFTRTTQTLEKQHNQLSTIVARQASAIDNINKLKTRIAAVSHSHQNSMAATEATDADGEVASDSLAHGGASEADHAVFDDERMHSAKPATSHQSSKKTSLNNKGGPILPLSVALGGAAGAEEPATASADDFAAWGASVTASMPAAFANDTRRIDARLTTLDTAQRQMVRALSKQARAQSAELQNLIELTGLNVESVLDTVASASEDDGQSEGGPLIPIKEPERKKGKAAAATQTPTVVDRLQADVDRLANLESAFESLPLIKPLEVPYRITSGFGKRYDPFTKQRAYHFGLDMVAPFRTPVHVTASGTVVRAGRFGPYGNLVEVDHGNGMRTRYGHLSAVKVKVGQTVKLGDVVGLLGSTGRSTGPHLHYEVRFNGTLRNPARFLRAGTHVAQG